MLKVEKLISKLLFGTFQAFETTSLMCNSSHLSGSEKSLKVGKTGRFPIITGGSLTGSDADRSQSFDHFSG